MKIDVLCNDGSPLGVTEKSIFGEDGRFGIGGAELALLTMCSAWTKYGYDVTLYNNPSEGGASSFPQKTLDEFIPSDDRDVLIIFRSPNRRSLGAKGYKVWWSTDQFTVDDFKWFATTVNKIVTISKFHADYFRTMYGINDTVSIDLPVRTQDYRNKVEKIPHRCIFTSIPDRGLMQLHAAWPLIVRDVPDASLVITSDWRLWDRNMDDSPTRNYRLAFASLPNVAYLGAVNRHILVEEQMKAEIMPYSCVYDELFCIAVAEAQVAGVYPITSNYGAVQSTNMGMVLAGNPSDPQWITLFSQKVVEQLLSPKLKENEGRIQELAIKRFSINNILDQWDKQVFCHD